MALLRVRKGTRPGRTFQVFAGRQPTTIGRGDECDITLEDDRASRKHARILLAYGSWVLQDLGSSNGTLVRGQAIDKARLENGAPVQIGNTLLSFHAEENAEEVDRSVTATQVEGIDCDESGVISCRGFQPAFDRTVRVDVLPSTRWALTSQSGGSAQKALLALLQRALESCELEASTAIEPVLHSELDRELGPAVVFRHGGETLSRVLLDVLASSLASRVDLTRQIVDAVLIRARTAAGRVPPSLDSLRVARDDRGSWRLSISAVELPALASMSFANLRHLPSYVPYLAPELTAEDRPIDSVPLAAIAYGLGAIGYHLLTGSPAMGEVSARKTLDNHRTTTPAPAALLESRLPDDLSEALDSLLQKDPESRLCDRGVLLATLDRSLEEVRRTEADEPGEGLGIDDLEERPPPAASAERPVPTGPASAGSILEGLDDEAASTAVEERRTGGRSTRGATVPGPRATAARGSAVPVRARVEDRSQDGVRLRAEDLPTRTGDSSRRAREADGDNALLRQVITLPLWAIVWVILFFGGRLLAKTLFDALF